MAESLIYFKFLAAFIFVIALMYLVAWGVKRMGLNGLTLPAHGTKRRLRVMEHLLLDSKHRAVLLRYDDKECVVILSPTHTTLVSPAHFSAKEMENV